MRGINLLLGVSCRRPLLLLLWRVRCLRLHDRHSLSYIPAMDRLCNALAGCMHRDKPWPARAKYLVYGCFMVIFMWHCNILLPGT